MNTAIRRHLAASPLARAAAFPLRTSIVARYDSQMIARSLRWLISERETTNFTYDLSEINREQLAWFVSEVTSAPVGQVRLWCAELEGDQELADSLRRSLSTNPRRGIGPTEAHWARRLGWYAMVRALQPERVVETGTHLGLGSTAIAAALLRNGHGRLTTVDVDPGAGHVIEGAWSAVVDRVTGSSVEVIARLEDVDMFIHDSLHTYDYETSELAAVAPKLRPDAVVLSDNAHDSSALSDWAERTGRRYLFFREQPASHWWPGDGIGAAWAGRGHARH